MQLFSTELDTMAKILKKKEEIDNLRQENFSIFRLWKLIYKVWTLHRYQSKFKDSDFYQNIFELNKERSKFTKLLKQINL